MRKGGKFMMKVEDHMTEDKNVIVKLYFSGEFFFFFFSLLGCTWRQLDQK